MKDKKPATKKDLATMKKDIVKADDKKDAKMYAKKSDCKTKKMK